MKLDQNQLTEKLYAEALNHYETKNKMIDQIVGTLREVLTAIE